MTVQKMHKHFANILTNVFASNIQQKNIISYVHACMQRHQNIRDCFEFLSETSYFRIQKPKIHK